MILDKRTEFSNKQAVTATAISDVIDLGATPTLRSISQPGLGQPFLVISCDETATAAGAATVTFSLESDSTADLATSATQHYVSPAIGKAACVAGAELARIPLPIGMDVERFLGVRYTVGTGPLTAGKFSAHITQVAPVHGIYPHAVN